MNGPELGIFPSPKDIFSNMTSSTGEEGGVYSRISNIVAEGPGNFPKYDVIDGGEG